MQLDEEAAYSVSNDISAKKVADYFVSKLRRKNLSIIDATACVGGNTMAFAKHIAFREVLALEIDPEKVKMLKHNLKQGLTPSEIQKTTVIHGDCLEEITKLNFSHDVVVFADPPWGGRSYKFQAAPDVHLRGKGSLDDFLTLCRNHPNISHLALKLPFNFDTSQLTSKDILDVFNLSTKVIIVLLQFQKQRQGDDDTNKKRRQEGSETFLNSKKQQRTQSNPLTSGAADNTTQKKKKTTSSSSSAAAAPTKKNKDTKATTTKARRRRKDHHDKEKIK